MPTIHNLNRNESRIPAIKEVKQADGKTCYFVDYKDEERGKRLLSVGMGVNRDERFEAVLDIGEGKFIVGRRDSQNKSAITGPAYYVDIEERMSQLIFPESETDGHNTVFFGAISKGNAPGTAIYTTNTEHGREQSLVLPAKFYRDSISGTYHQIDVFSPAYAYKLISGRYDTEKVKNYEIKQNKGEKREDFKARFLRAIETYGARIIEYMPIDFVEDKDIVNQIKDAVKKHIESECRALDGAGREADAEKYYQEQKEMTLSTIVKKQELRQRGERFSKDW